MNSQIIMVLKKRYEAEIEDAKYKIKCIEEHNMVIPEHVDITGEVDTLLNKIGKAEEKLSVMRKYYGDNVADKTVLQVSVTDQKKYFFSLKKSVLCVHLAIFCWYTRLNGGQGVDTFNVFSGRLGHFL